MSTTDHDVSGGRPTGIHMALQDHPAQLLVTGGLGALCWIGYWMARRKLRAS